MPALHFASTPRSLTPSTPALLATVTSYILLLSLAPPARSAQAEATGYVEEIVVQARKRGEASQEVPISIAALSERDLENSGVDSLADLGAAVPGLNFGDNTIRLQTFVGMRGVGDYSRNPGFDNRVGIYLDGMPVGRSNVTDYPLFDIAQLEVLRGPQGTHFGRNTLTGAMNLTTVEPARDPGYSVQLSAGSRQYRSAKTVVNQPLGQAVSARISLAAQERDGYINNRFDGDDLGGGEMIGGRLQVRYEPGDATKVSFSADFVDDEVDQILAEALAGPGLTVAPEIRDLSFSTSPYRERNLYGFGLKVEHQTASGFSLASLTSFRSAESEFAGNDLDLSPLLLASNVFRDDDRAFSQELRLISPDGERFGYVIGLFYYYQNPQSHWSTDFGSMFPVPSLIGTDVISRGDVTSHTGAAYVHGTFDVTPRLAFDAGARISIVDKEIEFDQAGAPPIGFPDIAGYEDDLRETSASPTASVRFAATPAINLYATYSTGTRSGGWNADFTQTDQIAFDEETVTNYELGVKSMLFRSRLLLNIVGYHMKFDDFQIQQLLILPGALSVAPVLTNAGSVTSQGVELDFEFSPLDNFSVSGGLGYNDAEFDRFKDGGGPGVDYDGNRLIEAPEYMASVAANFSRPVLAGRAKLQLMARYAYQSHTFSDPSNDPLFEQESFGTWGGRIGLISHDERWAVSVWARNLLDDDVQVQRSRSGLLVPGVVYNEPRFIGVEVEFQY